MGFGVLLLSLVLTCLVRLFQYIQNKSFANSLPAVEPCYPVIGNAMLVVGTNKEQLFSNISRALAKPTKLFKVMATIMPVVVTNDPAMTQGILTSPDCLEKAFLYKFFRLDYGLFAASCMWIARSVKFLSRYFNLFIPQMTSGRLSAKRSILPSIRRSCMDLFRYSISMLKSWCKVLNHLPMEKHWIYHHSCMGAQWRRFVQPQWEWRLKKILTLKSWWCCYKRELC